MAVDLSQYVGQEVEVTYEDGSHEVGKVEKNEHSRVWNKLYYVFCYGGRHKEPYTKDGFYWSSRIPDTRNITRIKPLNMKKYEQLENQIKELQAEVERLKKEEEAGTKLPRFFSRENAITFLKNPSSHSLCDAFHWSSAPQGNNYWSRIGHSLNENPSYKVPQEAIMAIQSWVIESYKEQYGV